MKRGEMLGGRDAAKAAGDQPVTGLVARLGMAPWVALFVVLLAWGWRAYDLWHTLPAYEDTLEVVWLIDWYNGALRGLHGAQVYPLAFHPAGWQVATYAGGPALFLVLLPLSWLGGAAFAANAGALLTFVLAFAGAHLLGRRLLERGPAALAALLFTFWSYRWYSTVGQHNVLLASALLPWLLLAADRALAASSSPHALSSDNPRPPAFFITPERSGAGRVPPRPASSGVGWR